MENKELADELERVNPGIKAQMAGYLLRPWLPHGATRKIIMIIIVIVALIGGVKYGQNLFFLLLLLLPCFSPRIVGEISLFIGKLSNK
jgi:hypothetical protein